MTRHQPRSPSARNSRFKYNKNYYDFLRYYRTNSNSFFKIIKDRPFNKLLSHTEFLDRLIHAKVKPEVFMDRYKQTIYNLKASTKAAQLFNHQRIYMEYLLLAISDCIETFSASARSRYRRAVSDKDLTSDTSVLPIEQDFEKRIFADLFTGLCKIKAISQAMSRIHN